MLRWLDDGGGEIELIQFHNGQAQTRRDVIAGEALFEIPLRHIITVETALASAIGRAVAATRLHLPQHAWLALFLLEEQRATDSFWRPYLSALPRRLTHIPLFFRGRDLEEVAEAILAGR